MDNFNANQKGVCCLICILVVLIISIILFALSWDTVEPTEWALKCSSISKSCDGSDSIL